MTHPSAINSEVLDNLLWSCPGLSVDDSLIVAFFLSLSHPFAECFQVATMTHLASNYLNVGTVANRLGTAHGSIVPYQVIYPPILSLNCYFIVVKFP